LSDQTLRWQTQLQTSLDTQAKAAIGSGMLDQIAANT
jgi:hypothetical protein